MTDSGPINIAVVGLGFGEDFLPVYSDHPDVGVVGIADPDTRRLREVGDRHGIEHRYESYDEVLADDLWDAVHILAPVSFHADYSLAALAAGKHCACAVPMGLEIAEMNAIVEAQTSSGKNYMMMETSVYGREFLYARQLLAEGRLGDVSFYRGYHIQNLDGYPSYWLGYPPMKYLTHALAPILKLTGSSVSDVVAYGSSALTKDRRGAFDNPFPVEMGLFRLSGTDIVADITMSFYQTARSYIEGFSLYGSSMSLEWPGLEGEPLRAFELLPLDPDQADTGLRGRRSSVMEIDPPDFVDGLPESIARYSRDYSFRPMDGTPEHTKLAEHGGSHPHLVHEFISSIVEGRLPEVEARVAANWSAAGVCAHESALHEGVRVDVRRFVR